MVKKLHATIASLDQVGRWTNNLMLSLSTTHGYQDGWRHFITIFWWYNVCQWLINRFPIFTQRSLQLVFCWLKIFLWKQLLTDTSRLTDTDSPELAKKLFDWLVVVLYSVDVWNSENENERGLTSAQPNSVTTYIVYAVSLTKQHS